MTETLGWIAPNAPLLDEQRFGTKASILSRAAKAGLPIPPGFVLPTDATDFSAEQLRGAFAKLEDLHGAPADLISVRASSIGPGSDVVPAVLNIGAAGEGLPRLTERFGERMARDLNRRLLHSYGVGVMGIDEEEFEYALYDLMREVGVETETELTTDQLAQLVETYSQVIDDMGAPLPADLIGQTQAALSEMAKLWITPRAKLRRQARGFEEDAPLARIVQVMVLGLGEAEISGAGLAHLRDPQTGLPGLTGRYLANAQGNEALMGLRTPRVLTQSERGSRGLSDRSLEECAPGAMTALLEAGRDIETELGDSYSIDFTLADGKLQILELIPLKRSARAAVQIAVDLAQSGAISQADALMRIGPSLVDEHLHPTIDPTAARDQIGQGLPASPGAAAGKLVFSPDTAEEAAASGERVLLALVETSPEDIRGMHAASGVLTVRGGMTSHAAVVARGLGKPCVVGAKDMTLNRVERTLTAPDGRVFKEGDVITVEGGEGQVLAGKVPTLEPEITGAFAQLMDWADEERRLGIRTNADTARDAGTALGFAAQGIGLCRTEHMFFQDQRISTMRQMILAETEEERRAALAKLLPMQRDDFHDLFVRMQGMPVVIRLLDPPLHEFLPHGQAEIEEMAAELAVTPQKIRARSLELAEFNPMLGNRGCRIGIAYPEIYQMQLRAVFEAVCHAARETGEAAKPEIMIPLVSAVREFDLLKQEVEAMAKAVSDECDVPLDYTIGVMIETPRACLRAGDIGALADFLSFGTNDLTQMLYGLSRDDAGRFIPNYVARGVFEHDPFHQIDEDGVGEIIRIGIERARERSPGVTIGLCGEHGGDPASVDFCHRAGFDYVSCSPFRVPVARLAAAQAAIRARQ